MVKKCIVCNDEAEYKIKDTSDFYCQDCAEESFADLNMLLKVEEEAKIVKELIAEKIKEELDTEDSNVQND